LYVSHVSKVYFNERTDTANNLLVSQPHQKSHKVARLLVIQRADMTIH